MYKFFVEVNAVGPEAHPCWKFDSAHGNMGDARKRISYLLANDPPVQKESVRVVNGDRQVVKQFSMTLVQTVRFCNVNVYHVPGVFFSLEEGIATAREASLDIKWKPTTIGWVEKSIVTHEVICWGGEDF